MLAALAITGETAQRGKTSNRKKQLISVGDAYHRYDLC